ncbi:hypothetical protein SAMN02745824_1534 [Parasphingorhabdus marina DSM 22363]|uniref:PD(D/E)XK endonuclease domain-containing protein n=1 Tax=Parasphingorhabdus marina DSM 22363 TaxID=1123272 RepID=A0A1N6D4Q5_9SPHN|nr:hypothetical protein [Parasphingorhabdus marina]SIN65686.1 hypothetical protein SAMN02745824_1534 [Parasphingorhabdus marina DSM 22363]
MNAPTNIYSHRLEKILEHEFLAGIGKCLWNRGIHDFEVLHSEIDDNGYDLIIEACGKVRHIQLKSKITGGRRAQINVHNKLLDKPSACVIIMEYDPATLAVKSYRFFGSEAGVKIPDIGERVVKHSRANAKGLKAIRPNLRNVPQSWFEEISNSEELCCRLFDI